MREELIIELTIKVWEKIHSRVFAIPEETMTRMREYMKICEIEYVSLEEQRERGLHGKKTKVMEYVEWGADRQPRIWPVMTIFEKEVKATSLSNSKKSECDTEIVDQEQLKQDIIREIVRVFSIGSCDSFYGDSRMYWHRSGIEMYLLDRRKNNIEIGRGGLLNCLLNEYIASDLYFRIFKQEYCENPRFSWLKFPDYVNNNLEINEISIEKLIRAYFSYDMEILKKALLAEETKSFMALEEKIRKYYKQKIPLIEIKEKTTKKRCRAETSKKRKDAGKNKNSSKASG